MRIGKPQPLRGKAVHVGSRDFRLGIVAARIAVAEVVRKDENDVGAFSGEKLGGSREERDKEEGAAEGNHCRGEHLWMRTALDRAQMEAEKINPFPHWLATGRSRTAPFLRTEASSPYHTASIPVRIAPPPPHHESAKLRARLPEPLAPRTELQARAAKLPAPHIELRAP